MAIRYFEVIDFYGDSGLPTGEVPEMYPSKACLWRTSDVRPPQDGEGYLGETITSLDISDCRQRGTGKDNLGEGCTLVTKEL
jgi:hypothetical protein